MKSSAAKSPTSFAARVVQEGYACRSQVYSQGGYMQKIALRARYGATWYELVRGSQPCRTL